MFAVASYRPSFSRSKKSSLPEKWAYLSMIALKSHSIDEPTDQKRGCGCGSGWSTCISAFGLVARRFYSWPCGSWFWLYLSSLKWKISASPFDMPFLFRVVFITSYKNLPTCNISPQSSILTRSLEHAGTLGSHLHNKYIRWSKNNWQLCALPAKLPLGLKDCKSERSFAIMRTGRAPLLSPKSLSFLFSRNSSRARLAHVNSSPIGCLIGSFEIVYLN